MEDDLTVTAFYFKQGEKQALMVSATVCLINTKLAARIRACIEEKFGIPANNCFISATHKRILSLSNTNGSEGYFITEDAICRGGYEVAMFKYGLPQPYRDNADFALVQNTVKHIKSVLY